MRLFDLVVTALATGAAMAQSPLTTTFAGNAGGNNGGAVYFDLAAMGATVNMVGFDLNFLEVPGSTGSVEVWTTPITSVGAELNIAAWSLHDTATVAATAGLGSPSNCALTTPLTIQANTSIGVAFVANGLSHAYTVGTAPIPLVYTACPLTLTAGTASNVPFGNPLFSPRVVNTEIRFTYAGTCATVAPQGDGCVAEFCSIYESLAPATMDLSGRTLTGSFFGAGYVIQTAPGGPVQPGLIGPPVTLLLGDDAQVVAGTLGISVGSNCWIATATGNSNAFAPSVATMLNNPASAIYSWTDLQPNAPGSGQVRYEEDAAGVFARVTYDGVFGWGTLAANTVQFDYDRNNGDFAIRWGTLGANNPQDWLVGYSCAGSSADPGPVDLSTGGPFFTAVNDVLPLALVATSGPPVQGQSATGVTVTTQNIPANALLHLGIVGLTRPGLPLGALGLPPSCSLHASLDLLQATVVPGFTAPSFLWTAVVLPALPPSFAGLEFNVQAATLGAMVFDSEGRTSNALKYVIGTL